MRITFLLAICLLMVIIPISGTCAESPAPYYQCSRAWLGLDSTDSSKGMCIFGVSWEVAVLDEFITGPPVEPPHWGSSDPKAVAEAQRKWEAKRLWAWEYFSNTHRYVILNKAVVNENGEIKESKAVGILPSYHPGDDFARLGSGPARFIDYGRLPAWIDKQLYCIDDQHFVLLERTPRAFLLRPMPEDSEFKMKKEGMLVFERLPDNPFLTKLPKGDYTLVSAAVLGKQVFVSTKGGWVASIDSEKETWSDASQPFEKADVYLVSDGKLLHALVFKNGKDERTLRHYTSENGKDWQEKEKLPGLVDLPTRFLLSGDDLYAVYEKAEDIVIESPKDAEGKTTKTTYPGIKYTSVSVSRLTAEKAWEEVVSRNLTDTRKFPMDYALQTTDKGTSLVILWAKAAESTEVPPTLQIEFVGENSHTIDITSPQNGTATPAEGDANPPAAGENPPPTDSGTAPAPEGTAPPTSSENPPPSEGTSPPANTGENP